MPLIQVKVIETVITDEQKQEIVRGSLCLAQGASPTSGLPTDS